MKRRYISLIIILLTLLSCKSTEGTRRSVPPVSRVVTATAVTSWTPVNVDRAGYFLPDPAAGLDILDSYSQTLVVKIEGASQESTANLTNSYKWQVNRGQSAYLANKESTGGNEPAFQVFSGDIGQTHYLQVNEGDCSVSPSASTAGEPQWSPEQSLLPIKSAESAGSEVINDIQSEKFTSNFTTELESRNYQNEVEVWIASQGGYVVKYLLRSLETTTGKVTTMEYQLEDVNSLIPVLPEGCLQVLTGFPVMADAVDIQWLPEVVAYASPSSPADIASFYATSLAGTGWEYASEHPYPKNGTTITYYDPASGKNALIILLTQSGRTFVTVTLMEATGY